MNSPPAVPEATTRTPWRLFVLLLVSVWINYIDRGNLSVAAPAIAPEFGLTATQVGVLLSAFFWTYAGLQILGGWLVDRFDAFRVYGAAFLIWSAATFLTGFAGSFTALLLFRLLLGVGESAAYPAYSRLLASRFPEHRRGFANALVDFGGKAGPALGTFVGGLLVAHYGWRAMFFLIGGISFLWLVPWLSWAPREGTLSGASCSGPSILKILSLQPAWATFLGLFCFNYAYYFLMTWLPSYLVMDRHFSLTRMAVFSALPFAVSAVTSLVSGYASDRLIARGGAASQVRKSFAVTGVLLCAGALLGVGKAPTTLAMAFLILSFASIGLFSSNVWAITQTLAGPAAAGRWTGIQNAIGNLGGVVAPVVTGILVSRFGSFYLAFLAASLSLLLAALMYVLVLGPVVPVVWPQGRAET